MTKRRQDKSLFPWLLGLGLGAAAGYGAALFTWTANFLSRQDVRRTLSEPANTLNTGLTYEATRETDSYAVRHTIENGIERIHYRPFQPRSQTPILFAHGMWHGAWCWSLWQELFAGWGLESVAYSLPGHAMSPEQRPIRTCTLDYYLAFLRAEVQRLPTRPVLVGHSMGGALAQWYLKHVADDLPAVVLLASWPHQISLWDGFNTFMLNDPIGTLGIFADWSATRFVRSPAAAAHLLITPHAALSPEALHARLGPESALVLSQYMPFNWSPPENVRTPILVVAGDMDVLVRVNQLYTTAEHYWGDFYVARDAGHNVQMDGDWQATAAYVRQWLEKKLADVVG